VGKVPELSTFKSLTFKVQFMPTKRAERIVRGQKRRPQEWASSATVSLLSKEGRTMAQRIANGLEEIAPAMKKLLSEIGVTGAPLVWRPKKK
jgi:hypothetical protein